MSFDSPNRWWVRVFRLYLLLYSSRITSLIIKIHKTKIYFLRPIIGTVCCWGLKSSLVLWLMGQA